MNQNNIIFYISALLFCCYTYPMHSLIEDIKEKLYKDFKLTVPYGKLTSHFDILPNDVINNCIKPLLAEMVTIEFKHRQLTYKHLKKLLQAEAVDTIDKKSFQRWDGMYCSVPDIANYAEWDNGSCYDDGSLFGYGIIPRLPFRTKKASYSPDRTKLAIALVNGELEWWDFSSDKFFDIDRWDPLLTWSSCHSNTWRVRDKSDIDDQAPRILWSKHNNLFFSLDPADHTDKSISTFIVRDATSGKPLATYNFFPNNPTEMGLIKDENTIVFVDRDDNVFQLHVYDGEDIKNFAFIKEKANFYQCCMLAGQLQRYKLGIWTEYIEMDTKPFQLLRSYIVNCQKSQGLFK